MGRTSFEVITEEMNSNHFFAHSKDGVPLKSWQPLQEHLENVSHMAAGFAGAFQAQDWGRIAGLWHDLGKGTLPWQAYLRHANGLVDEFAEFYEGHVVHAIVGAQSLFELSREAGKLLAYCIAGHHGGMPNWNDEPSRALESNLKKPIPEINYSIPIPEVPFSLPIKIEGRRFGFQLQFFVRMLFSCLVDADFLDTEASLSEEKSSLRTGYPILSELSDRFWENFNTLRCSADSKLAVNQNRESVLGDCLRAAEQEPGLFSLTVPTGGGKTLASLAFALKHAKKYSKRRIIYVIPFTSIIEQNARVFKKMLGDDAVLEHHCNFFPNDPDWKSKLASENWDVPLVVTTNVQFFDSFYANKPSKCRKLHNVADSVVIFDEVQAIPVEKLVPCLEVIKELSVNYGVTSVLCTATQPAIEYSDKFVSGLKNVREIVGDVPKLFLSLKRTEEFYIGELTEQEIADKLAQYEQVLCIVNTRQQALDIYKALPESDYTIHLSALMYPAHRSVKLDEIRERLDNNQPCRVVSTQLIEAGVDVDFPAVFRVVSGIDSIAQAAGRCNRNGLHEQPCNVFIFDLPETSSVSFFKQAAQSAAKLFDSYSGQLTSPECVTKYFEDYFWKNQQRMDSDGVVERCMTAQSGNIQFRELAEFKMIRSASIPIIIALEPESIELIQELDFAEYKGVILRKLQRYVVQIYPYQFDEIQNWFEYKEPGVWCLRSDEMYSASTGLNCSSPQGKGFIL